MCGIAGFTSLRPLLDGHALAAMRDTLAHRGPDGHGLNLWDERGAPCTDLARPCMTGLAHTRLSVIDLSPAGHQPMCNEDQSLWIAYNGECYNFMDERPGLEARGHTFRSHTDTETLLHLFEEVGIRETLLRANGMFALALWDRNRQTLTLARDRIGKKPLYYALLPDGSVLFASEMKALLASGLVDSHAIDPAALVQLWTYGYTIGEHTLYAGIRRLLPGHFATWRAGTWTVTEYWDCPFGMNVSESRPMAELAEELEALLSDAIRKRLVADVPVGLFLSGGIDSSLIAALSAKVAGRDLSAFTIAFPDADFNEAPQAQSVARHLGLDCRVLTVSERMEPQFQRIARQFDEPFGDSSAIPTFFVSKLAREHVTVALTGDAGDELFAGYDLYREGLRLWGSTAERAGLDRPRGAMERIWDLHRRWTPPSRRLSVWERQTGPLKRRRIFSAGFRGNLDLRAALQSRERWYARVAGADLLSQMQYVNLKTYLPDDILVKVDRMSMAHALECRCPFLDWRVVEFAARLPRTAKMDAQGTGKLILRAILAKHLPESLIQRKKQGFAVPWQRWNAGAGTVQWREDWRRMVSPYFDPRSADFLFPPDGAGSTFLQWTAFACLQFQEELS